MKPQDPRSDVTDTSRTMADDRLPELKPTAGDAAHAVVKAAVSAIPLLGGPASELVSAFAPPLARRRDEFLKALAEGLAVLRAKVDGLSVEALAQDEEFLTILHQASDASIRTHRVEKREALRNAVLNTALQRAPEEDIAEMFVRFVSDFTPWHIRVLRFIQGKGRLSISRSGSERPMAPRFELWELGICREYPELEEESGFVRCLLNDLTAFSLMEAKEKIKERVSGYTKVRGEQKPKFSYVAEVVFKVNEMGEDFLQYVSAPEELRDEDPADPSDTDELTDSE